MVNLADTFNAAATEAKKKVKAGKLRLGPGKFGMSPYFSQLKTSRSVTMKNTPTIACRELKSNFLQTPYNDSKPFPTSIIES
jgi:hypothetical protein